MERTGPEDHDNRSTAEDPEGVAALPDPERISSVETVRAYLSQHESDALGADGWETSDRNRAAASTPTVTPADGPSAPPVDLPTGRAPTDRASTSVWEGAPMVLSPHPAHRDVPIGERYEILERVAAGGMAEIFRVRHLSLGKEFALKLIHYAHPDAAPRMRQLFYREAQLVSRMDHPNIVSVTDFGVDPEQGAYIVMEYLKGETLYRRLHRQQRLRVHTALEVALQVAEALHYMHGQSVIHCDVKAENVFLCHTDSAGSSRSRIQVKIIDFGLSRPRTAGVVLARDEVGGTPQYMAPELIRGQSPQPSMDIYALGVLLYEMITGMVPLEGSSPAATIQAQLEQEPVPPSALLDSPLESRVESIIMQALRKGAAERQPSMGHVIFQLRTVMQMYGLRGARYRRSTPAERPAVSTIPAHRQLVLSSPLPMFQLDSQGHLVFVNKAFCRFVREQQPDLLGRRIGDTRLAMVYPSVQSDAEACSRQRNRVPLRRGFAFELEDGERNELLCWLRPETSPEGRVLVINGYIHQLA